MNLETKIVLLTVPIAAVLLVVIWFVFSLTKPDCPPGLHAYNLPKAYNGGGWRCLPPRHQGAKQAS